MWRNLNNLLLRFLVPGAALYFVVLLLFSAVAVFMGQYALAAVEFVVTVILCWLGAFTAASPFNLMLFAILWTLPALLLTSIAGK